MNIYYLVGEASAAHLAGENRPVVRGKPVIN